MGERWWSDSPLSSTDHQALAEGSAEQECSPLQSTRRTMGEFVRGGTRGNARSVDACLAGGFSLSSHRCSRISGLAAGEASQITMSPLENYLRGLGGGILAQVVLQRALGPTVLYSKPSQSIGGGQLSASGVIIATSRMDHHSRGFHHFPARQRREASFSRRDFFG